MRTVTSSTNDVSYILSDQLGSTTQTVTNGVVATQKYYPYGATRGTPGTLPTDKLFTGQQQEPGDALGLYNYKARFYSTTLGRFISVDPVGGRIDKPQSWNAYSYAYSNPLKHIDPSGKCIPDSDGPRGCGLDPSQGTPDNLQNAQRQAYNGDVPDGYSSTDAQELQALANSGASVADLLAAAATGDPAEYLKQVYAYDGHRDAPSLLEAAGSALESLAPGKGCCIWVDGVEVPADVGVGADAGSGVDLSAPKGIPDNVRSVDAYVKGGNGEAPPGYRGGDAYQNDGRGGTQVLRAVDSSGNPITYREYDVNPLTPGRTRGAERLVVGSDGGSYYTDDHYMHFTNIQRE